MKTNILSFSLCAMFALQSTAHGAGVPVPRDTVGERIRPELQPTGIRVASFTLSPRLSTQVLHDDNIYAQATGAVGDTVTIATPSLVVRSNWARHAVGVSASADLGRYADNASENYSDTSVRARGRIDVTRGSEIHLGAQIDQLHDDRYSPDNRNGFAPTEYDRQSYFAGYERNAGRVVLRIDAALTRLNYHDAVGTNGVLSNNDRDRREPTAGFRASYMLGDSAQVYVRGGIARTEYDRDIDDEGFRRSSNSDEIAVGATLDVTAVTSLDAFIGYAMRNYDDRLLDDIDTFWFGGQLVWRLSGLTTLSAIASRRIEETTLRGAGGYVATRFGAAVDHELLRNLVLNWSVWQQENQFAGIDRHDHITGSSLQANYMMNRNLSVVLNYAVRDRDVHEPVDRGDGYDSHVVSLRITHQR